MAATTDAAFDHFISATWTCLVDTPFNQKNLHFDQFFTSLPVLQRIASQAGVTFAPGLFDVVHSDAPPTIEVFKQLPEETSSVCWADYLLVLEKPGCRPLTYVGSGTDADNGVDSRLTSYDKEERLPQYVEDALKKGYTIVHKGLLCWIPLPSAGKVPVYRLLIVALEATFAYIFWAMRTPNFGDYGMSHMCPWDRRALEYDGLCSHCALNEGIRGDFDLTEEQLEVLAVEKEKKRLELKALNATNYHYKQMAENYDEYITDANARVAKSRANNPGRDAKRQADRIDKALASGTFVCTLCDLSFGTKQRLDNHKQTPKHARKVDEKANPFRCHPCNLGYHNKSNLTRHFTSERHRKAVAALKEEEEGEETEDED